MNKLEFIVLMFGARRTGKTSVLASMLTNFQEVAAGTNVSFTPETKTMVKLQEKREELEHVFNSKTCDSVWEIDPSPTSEVAVYSFKMNMKNTVNEYEVKFVDMPGEFINDAGNIIEVQEWLMKSDVVIIAIDTPHMMEENGKFNEAFNKTMILHHLFVDSKQFYETGKMLLFVPLKCEKYYHENRMNEVNQAVKRSYQTIIAHMGNPNVSSKITMAITPILTMGDVVFSHFGLNNRKLIETIDLGGEKYRPRHVYYKLRNRDARFSPKYCEQPLVYTLTYISKVLQSK